MEMEILFHNKENDIWNLLIRYIMEVAYVKWEYRNVR